MKKSLVLTLCTLLAVGVVAIGCAKEETTHSSTDTVIMTDTDPMTDTMMTDTTMTGMTDTTMTDTTMTDTMMTDTTMTDTTMTGTTATTNT